MEDKAQTPAAQPVNSDNGVPTKAPPNTPTAPSNETSPAVQAMPPPTIQSRGPSDCEKSPTSNRSKEDEAAGSMLLGFLSSLRKGFEEAKLQKDKEEQMRVATETASAHTTNPAESSLDDDDSASDKEKTFSSEDSEKDSYAGESMGPPRKRHKAKKSSEFTSENVAQHTSRMNLLHGGGVQHGWQPQGIPVPAYATQGNRNNNNSKRKAAYLDD